MTDHLHLRNIISNPLLSEIRDFSKESEKMKQLHPIQLEIAYNQNWFNLFVPKQFGGLEVNLVDGLKIQEAIASADGSMGWTITLCSGANWFIGFLPPQVAATIFNNPKVCLAGSGMVAGVARETKTGYEVNGYWRYATGAPHATVFTANCMIEKDGDLIKDDKGNPTIRSFWFLKEEVQIHSDWNAMGMIATASNSFKITNLAIPKERAFLIDSKHCFLDSPIYKYPFLQFAETTLSVNVLGMVIHFLDLCEVLFATKAMKTTDETDLMLKKLESCKKRIEDKRQSFYTTVEESWNELIGRQLINEKLLDEVSVVCKNLVTEARLVVYDLFPYCGMNGIEFESDINREWRNIQTAFQHKLLR